MPSHDDLADAELLLRWRQCKETSVTNLCAELGISKQALNVRIKRILARMEKATQKPRRDRREAS